MKLLLLVNSIQNYPPPPTPPPPGFDVDHYIYTLLMFGIVAVFYKLRKNTKKHI